MVAQVQEQAEQVRASALDVCASQRARHARLRQALQALCSRCHCAGLVLATALRAACLPLWAAGLPVWARSAAGPCGPQQQVCVVRGAKAQEASARKQQRRIGRRSCGSSGARRGRGGREEPRVRQQTHSGRRQARKHLHGKLHVRCGGRTGYAPADLVARAVNQALDWPSAAACLLKPCIVPVYGHQCLDDTSCIWLYFTVPGQTFV